MTEKAVSIQDMSRIHLIFGDFDNNINIIQKEYKVSIFTRDDEIRIKGDENAVDNAEQVIKTLISTVEKGETPTEQSVRYAISMTNYYFWAHETKDSRFVFHTFSYAAFSSFFPLNSWSL